MLSYSPLFTEDAVGEGTGEAGDRDGDGREQASYLPPTSHIQIWRGDCILSRYLGF